MSEPLDDAHLHDPAVIAWKNMNALIENNAPDSDVDQAFAQYLKAVSEQMVAKEKRGRAA